MTFQYAIRRTCVAPVVATSLALSVTLSSCAVPADGGYGGKDLQLEGAMDGCDGLIGKAGCLLASLILVGGVWIYTTGRDTFRSARVLLKNATEKTDGVWQQQELRYRKRLLGQENRSWYAAQTVGSNGMVRSDWVVFPVVRRDDGTFVVERWVQEAARARCDLVSPGTCDRNADTIIEPVATGSQFAELMWVLAVERNEGWLRKNAWEADELLSPARPDSQPVTTAAAMRNQMVGQGSEGEAAIKAATEKRVRALLKRLASGELTSEEAQQILAEWISGLLRGVMSGEVGSIEAIVTISAIIATIKQLVEEGAPYVGALRSAFCEAWHSVFNAIDGAVQAVEESDPHNANALTVRMILNAFSQTLTGGSAAGLCFGQYRVRPAESV